MLHLLLRTIRTYSVGCTAARVVLPMCLGMRMSHSRRWESYHCFCFENQTLTHVFRIRKFWGVLGLMVLTAATHQTVSANAQGRRLRQPDTVIKKLSGRLCIGGL